MRNIPNIKMSHTMMSVGIISAQNFADVRSFTSIFVFISGFFNPISESESRSGRIVV
jgi:hypothetical protein